MRRIAGILAAALVLTAALPFSAQADAVRPVETTVSDDGTELRAVYVLSPEEDPASIPTGAFEQDGFTYSLAELLREEQTATEERAHTETVTAKSERNDRASLLALFPAEREAETEDGFSGKMSLLPETVRAQPGEYGTASRTLTMTRTHSNVYNPDTEYIPPSLTDAGHTMTLQGVAWQRNEAGIYTGTATYACTVTENYVKSYTVTAEYSGTVSRTYVAAVRYEAVFAGTPHPTPTPEPTPKPTPTPTATPEPTPETEEPQGIDFPWIYVWITLGVLALLGGGTFAALLLKRKSENEYREDDEEEE